jgi:hypothetical protein
MQRLVLPCTLSSVQPARLTDTDTTAGRNAWALAAMVWRLAAVMMRYRRPCRSGLQGCGPSTATLSLT